MRNTEDYFEFDVKIYFEDTDAGGVVYHANYLRYMERARVELMASLGVEQRTLAERYGVSFVVRSIHISYKSPARLEDLLTVRTQPVELGSARLVLEQDIVFRGTEKLVVSSRVEVVSVDSKSLRPRRMPHEVAAKIRGNMTGQ